MSIVNKFMAAILKLSEGEIVMITRQSNKEINHFKVKMITIDCFELTIFNDNFKIMDDVRVYTVSGILSIFIEGMFEDHNGKRLTPVLEMHEINSERVKLNSTFLCLN